MNVIYALSHLEDWVGFAREMRKRLGWEPVYWLTTNVTDVLVKQDFPQAVRQKYIDIIRGISPKEVDLYAPKGIDEDVIRDYAFEMDQAIKMMDKIGRAHV